MIKYYWKATIILAAAATVPRHASSQVSASATSTDRDNDNSQKIPRRPPISGRIEQSLFRFPASKLGREFDDILKLWYEDWLHVPPGGASRNDTTASSEHTLPSITPEAAGLRHAFESVSTPAATLFRRQCYGPAPVSRDPSNRYPLYEIRRKEISFQYNPDPMEETRLLHALTKRFYPAFLPEDDGRDDDGGDDDDTRRIHKKKSTSTASTVYAGTTLPGDIDSIQKLSFQTVPKEERYSVDRLRTQQWSWHPPAHFSSRGTPDSIQFRNGMFTAMRLHLERGLRASAPDFGGLDHGRPSGMFWYPPGGVREWHNNRADLVGHTGTERRDAYEHNRNEDIFRTQVWRMYFVRTVRDPAFDEKLARLRKTDGCDESGNDHSAMHIIPGMDDGITLDVLRKAGARPLTEEEKMRQWSDEFAEDYKVRNDTREVDDRVVDDGLDRFSMWRIPDQDGYVTLFRLPHIWHCIVSEEVHRYSLGFALSDREVQALLRMADVPYDVAGGGTAHDEL